jgi:hypothetical protein
MRTKNEKTSLSLIRSSVFSLRTIRSRPRSFTSAALGAQANADIRHVWQDLVALFL